MMPRTGRSGPCCGTTREIAGTTAPAIVGYSGRPCLPFCRGGGGGDPEGGVRGTGGGGTATQRPGGGGGKGGGPSCAGSGGQAGAVLQAITRIGGSAVPADLRDFCLQHLRAYIDSRALSRPTAASASAPTDPIDLGSPPPALNKGKGRLLPAPLLPPDSPEFVPVRVRRAAEALRAAGPRSSSASSSSSAVAPPAPLASGPSLAEPFPVDTLSRPGRSVPRGGGWLMEGCLWGTFATWLGARVGRGGLPAQ